MISTKGRYALRLLLDLASQDSDEYIPLRAIAQRQNISEKYLQIVIREMVQAKLIKGISGKKGGYRLTRNPSEYTVGEILSLEETSSPARQRWIRMWLPMTTVWRTSFTSRSPAG